MSPLTTSAFTWPVEPSERLFSRSSPSAGAVRGLVQELRRADDFPDVQELPESADQLRHPGGGGSRSHRAARVRVQRQEAQTILCPGE